MKKISVLLILAVLIFLQTPSNAGIISVHKARVEQNRIEQNNIAQIKALFNEQTKQANKHNLLGIKSTFSPDFISSDGFNFNAYMKLIEDTWESYPDIAYNTEINNIEINNNYATVITTETAFAAPTEEIGNFTTVGELYSKSKCIYYLQKQGEIWLIHSEKVLEETSMLKYGEARYTNIELNAPKQVGANQYYTVTLKVDTQPENIVVASIGNGEVVYPQTKSDETFRRLSDDKVLERIFRANSKNINEYATASVGITRTEDYDEKHVKVYMTGLAFIMTRVNVIPANKFIEEIKLKSDENGKGNNEQSK